MGPDTLAYLTVLVINFVDRMGEQCTQPLIVPYGMWMGASLDVIALFTTVRGMCAIVSVFWMPKLSDMRGRKLAIVVALFGCSIGYLVQGVSAFATDGAIVIFMIGRGLVGLCAGLAPVLRAYITEISMSDQETLKRRLVVLQVSSQAAGIALQPIAGSLATFGLVLPFFVCFFTCVVGSVWTCCLFQEAEEITRMSERVREMQPASKAPQALSREGVQEGNPLLDKVILSFLCGNVVIFVSIVASSFLIPVMLAQQSFGLERDTKEATQGKIAEAQGLVSMAFGVCQMFVSLFLYTPVTKRCGEIPVLTVAGVLASLSFGSYGMWVTKLSHLACIHGVGGVCFGFLLPTVSPAIGRYASVHYRKNIAFCHAVPVFGSQIAVAVGQNIMVGVFNSAGMQVCWIVCGVGIFIFTVLIAIACVLVEWRSPQKDTLTSDQNKLLLQAGGLNTLHPPQDVEQFIQSMGTYVRETLLARRSELWNGTAQFLYFDAVRGSLQSKFRDWNDATQGEEYLQDMYEHLIGHPYELEEFSQNFPNIIQSMQAADVFDLKSSWISTTTPVPLSPMRRRLPSTAEDPNDEWSRPTFVGEMEVTLSQRRTEGRTDHVVPPMHRQQTV